MLKVVQFLLIFVIINLIVSIVWYAVELLTLVEIQESTEDTVICLILSLLLSIVITNKKVEAFLNNSNNKEQKNG